MDVATSVVTGLELSDEESTLVEFRRDDVVTPVRQQTVYWRQRPLTGGYQIGPKECTMTVGAWRGSEQLMLTASHCTATEFSPDGGATRQNVNAVSFGFEVTDPASYYCGSFSSPHRRCRHFDAAAYDASGVDLFPDDSLGWVAGRIARTTLSVSGLSQIPGANVIDIDNPYWTVVTEIAYPILGETLHKVGVANGWTYGPVYETCKDTSVNGVRIVCSDKANMYARDGDSGAPVFVPYGGSPGTAAFYGVVFGHQNGASAVFSNLGQMKQDLGSIRLF